MAAVFLGAHHRVARLALERRGELRSHASGELEGARIPFTIVQDETLRSTATGIFYPLVARGVSVKKRALLGYVTDFFGRRTAEARAPFDGVIPYILGTPPVSEGEPLVSLGQLGNEPGSAR